MHKKCFPRKECSLTIMLVNCVLQVIENIFFKLNKKKVILYISVFREIHQRQEAVNTILDNFNCSVLTKLRSVLGKSPDLERGLCSIYHEKVCFKNLI